MRNALGEEFGGSGVPLEEPKYRESVAFWVSHSAGATAHLHAAALLTNTNTNTTATAIAAAAVARRSTRRSRAFRSSRSLRCGVL